LLSPSPFCLLSLVYRIRGGFVRCFKGTYVSVEPWHLHRYVDEQAFRFNERKITDSERFAEVMSSVAGKRLTYKALTGNETPLKGLLPGSSTER